MKNHRNYKNSEYQERVEKTYKDMLENQTINYVLKMKKRYNEKDSKGEYKIWNLIDKLENITDTSDPDNDLPQIVHAYQTALSIKSRYINNDIEIKSLFHKKEWDNLPEKIKKEYNKSLKNYYNHIKDWNWLYLVGFIHDLGKILLLPEFGKLPQWSVVGDTFPVGCELSNNYVFYEKTYHKNNDSLLKNTYNDFCGFNNMHFSWGHDEYLASILEKNINKLNLNFEAIYIIRYHSFYSWHSPRNFIRGYTKFASELDWKMLPLLKAFQKADLYSKTREIQSIDKIKKEFKYLDNIILEF
jgi:inositol oxygenase